MIFKALLLISLISSCLSMNTFNKHRYIIFEEAFDGKNPLELNNIYRILGPPSSERKDGEIKYLSTYDTKTTDFYYSVTTENDKVLSLILMPSENGKDGLDIDEALKIFSHLTLEKSKKWNFDNPHVFYEEFFYRSKDKRFEIKFNGKNKVDYISWAVNPPTSKQDSTIKLG